MNAYTQWRVVMVTAKGQTTNHPARSEADACTMAEIYRRCHATTTVESREIGEWVKTQDASPGPEKGVCQICRCDCQPETTMCYSCAHVAPRAAPGVGRCEMCDQPAVFDVTPDDPGYIGPALLCEQHAIAAHVLGAVTAGPWGKT